MDLEGLQHRVRRKRTIVPTDSDTRVIETTDSGTDTRTIKASYTDLDSDWDTDSTNSLFGVTFCCSVTHISDHSNVFNCWTKFFSLMGAPYKMVPKLVIHYITDHEAISELSKLNNRVLGGRFQRKDINNTIFVTFLKHFITLYQTTFEIKY